MAAEKADKTPMYQHIADLLKDHIRKGVMKPHDRIATQIELAKAFKTSEITARKALSELVAEGYIYRIRGRGSFVQEVKTGPAHQEMKAVYFVHRIEGISRFNHPFFMNMLNGIREACEASGLAFYLWDIDSDYALPSDPGAGVILLCNQENFDLSYLPKWKADNRRLVTVHFYYPHLNIPYVIIDNLTGGYLATQHLLSLGHSKIGIIMTGKSLFDLNQEFSLRLEGYKLALSQHKIPFQVENVAVVSGTDENEDMGAIGFQQLMSLPEPPTAIFATSDYKAIGAMRQARKMGISIPGDISIIGYDDLSIGELCYPRLTSVNQNTCRLGKRAVEILLNSGDNGDDCMLKDEIVPSIVVRGSTSALHAAK